MRGSRYSALVPLDAAQGQVGQTSKQTCTHPVAPSRSTAGPHPTLDSVVDTLGIRVDDRSFVPVPLALLSPWEDAAVDVEAPVRLICITMLVIASSTWA